MQARLTDRSPLRSGSFGFEYNPFTLLTKYAKKKGGAEGISPNYSYVDFHRSKIHEMDHWIAFNSTSIGNLFSLMLFTRARTVVNLLWESSQKARNAVVASRFNRGRPLIALRDDGSLSPESFTDNPEEFHPLCQIWHDHLVGFNMLYSSSLQDHIDLPRGAVIGEVMGDAILYATEEVGLSSNPGTKIARGLYAQDETPFLFHCGQRLTTRLMFEALATANEVMSLRSYSLGSKIGIKGCELEPHIEDLAGEQGLSGGYGLAIQMICDIAGAVGLESICPVLYLALNPPVPPVVFPEDPVHWYDLYPPIRLLRIAKVVSTVGKLGSFATPQVLKEYISKLADAAELHDPNEFEPPATQLFDRFRCFDSIGPEWDAKEAKDHYRFLLWTQHNMWSQRDRAMPLLVNLGGCMSGPQSQQYAKEILNMDGEGAWLHPRIIWTEKDNLGHVGDTVRFGSWLMLSQADHYYLDDFISGTGPFDLSPYPPSVRNDLLQLLEEHLTALFMSASGEQPLNS